MEQTSTSFEWANLLNEAVTKTGIDPVSVFAILALFLRESDSCPSSMPHARD
jgi:hypothetical protein